MSLSFLHPLAPPLPSTISHFLRLSRRASTLASSKTPSSPPSAPSPKKAASSITTSTPILTPRPYRITRTGTNGLPVYLLSKRGGNLKQTKLRRIEGDINVLRTDLQVALGVDEKEVTINQLTKQIIVKGHKKSEVLKFLQDNELCNPRKEDE